MRQVKDIVVKYESLSDGDKLAIATKVIEKEKKQEQAIDIMADMLRSKQTELKVYQAKLGRKLTEKEVEAWVNGLPVPALLDEIDKELLQEGRKKLLQAKKLTGI